MRKSRKINAALAAAREAKKNKCLPDIFESDDDLDGNEYLSDIPIFAGTKLAIPPPRTVNLVGAALMTGCEYEIKETEGTQARKPSKLMNQEWVDNIQNLGVPVNLTLGPGRGSSDFGNVSQVVPAIHPYIGISEENIDIPAHSVEFAKASATPFAFQQMHKAAAAMAAIGLKVLTCEQFRLALKEEFKA